MRIVLFIFFMLSGFLLQAQVQLTSIKKSDVKFKIPIAQREIPGQTGYFQEYGDLAVLMDSVGIPEGVIIDSLKYNETTDSLTLYTSTGNYKAYIPMPAAGVTGSGTATRLAFWSGTSTLSSNSNLFWDNSNSRLGIGTSSPTYPLHVEGRGYFNQGSSNLFLNGGNTTLSGTSNFALGNTTLQSLTTGYQNVGIGVGAAPAITTGYANFALGAQSLNACQGCYSNIAIGNQSLFTNISGFRNVAIGQEALAFTTTDASTAVGFYALRSQTTGQYNTGIGYFSAYQNTTGSGNLSAGFFSGPVSGSDNTVLGYYAGSGTTGSGNVLIGKFAGGGTLTQSNRLYIANSSVTNPLIGGQFDNARVGINKVISSLSSTLHVGGDLTVDTRTGTATTVGGWTSSGTATSTSVGTGLTLSSGTLSNAGDLSNTNELQTISTSGAAGNITLSNGGGTLNLNVNDADASTTNELQTLSWSSPNLSISSGNSVTLPVLPSASSSQTLAYLSGTWTPSSFLKTNSSTTASGNSKRVTINDDIGGESWPLSINTATKFLVNGKVQMNSTSSGAVTSIMGRNDIMEVGSVTIGSDMQLTSGILSKKQVLGVLARNSSSSTFSTSSTPAKLDFNVAMVQVNATASTANDDIVTTITSYGAYEINCDCQFNPGATATYNFGIYVNGSLNGALVKQIPMTSGVTHDVSIFGYVSSLSTTDEIDIRVSTGSGTSGNTIGRCMLALKGI